MTVLRRAPLGPLHARGLTIRHTIVVLFCRSFGFQLALSRMQSTRLAAAGAAAGVVLKNGAGCGYVFAPHVDVTASIAFVCDQSATGVGRVSADTTHFMRAFRDDWGLYRPGAYDPGRFCNLNLTWRTSLVCSLPGALVPRYYCTNNACVKAPDGTKAHAGLTLENCTASCGAMPRNHFRCVDNRCVASAVGVGSNASCATACGTAPKPCAAALEAKCGAAKRAGAGNCLVCCGAHQQDLEAAGCTNADFNEFCR
eukprot:SAG11_NODE_2001_length_3939_cov_26.376672_3_plen_255_part_00